MTLLNTLLETCATVTQKVANLEQDKVAQALEIIKLKQRVSKIEKKRSSKSSGLKRLRKVGTSQRVESSDDTVVDASKQGGIAALDTDEDVTLVYVDTTIEIDADIQGRMEENVTDTKEINAAEPTMQEKHLDNIKKYQSSSSTKQDTLTVDPTEISKEDVQNMLQIILMAEFKVEAFQVKYPLIDWEIYSEGSKTYWRIIRVGGITQAYQSFKDMLKDYDREDLDALVHQVSLTTRRYDIYMLAEKDYPLSDGVITLMLSSRLQVEEDSEVARDLVMKIFLKANQPKSKTLELMMFKTSRKCTKGLLLLAEELALLVQVNVVRKNNATAKEIKKLL
nr:hypothetical protein [Tanacetum cinerariifolium]